MSFEVTVLASLSPAEAAEVAAAASVALTYDGGPPLNEAALLHLRHPRITVSHLLVRHGDVLAAYGQVDSSAEPAVGQLFVSPDHRRRGLGTALVEAMLERATALRIWAKGDSPAARALAARTGLQLARQLLIMERDLDDDLGEPTAPPGVTIRTFVPGQDEDAWLAVNAAAFADHPEQGSITRSDLAERMAEDWFDPAGFFLAVAGDDVIGFHWTKRHPDQLGEVYVLGIEPGSAGRGLGKTLLLTGLRHLRDVGDTRVELYVEGDNERALALYRGYGFAEVSRDVMYALG